MSEDSFEEYKSEEDAFPEAEQVTKIKQPVNITSENDLTQGKAAAEDNISVIPVSVKDDKEQKESGDKKEKKKKTKGKDSALEDGEDGQKKKKKEKKPKEGKKERKPKEKKDEEKINEIRVIDTDQKEIISVVVKEEEAPAVELIQTEKIDDAVKAEEVNIVSQVKVEASVPSAEVPVSATEVEKAEEVTEPKSEEKPEPTPGAAPPAAHSLSKVPVAESSPSDINLHVEKVESVKADVAEKVSHEAKKPEEPPKETAEIQTVKAHEPETELKPQPVKQEPKSAEESTTDKTSPAHPTSESENLESTRPSSEQAEKTTVVEDHPVAAAAAPAEKPKTPKTLSSGVVAILEHAQQVADSTASTSSNIMMARNLIQRQEKLREHLMGMRHQFSDIDSEIQALKMDSMRNRQRSFLKH